MTCFLASVAECWVQLFVYNILLSLPVCFKSVVSLKDVHFFINTVCYYTRFSSCKVTESTWLINLSRITTSLFESPFLHLFHFTFLSTAMNLLAKNCSIIIIVLVKKTYVTITLMWLVWHSIAEINFCFYLFLKTK